MATHPSVIPTTPFEYHDAINGRLPNFWFGKVAPDGDINPWKGAVLGSMYIANVSDVITTYVKTANNLADADWATWGSLSETGFIPVSLGSLRRVISNDIIEELYNKKLVTQSIPLVQLRRVVSNDVTEPLYNNRLMTHSIPLTQLRRVVGNDIVEPLYNNRIERIDVPLAILREQISNDIGDITANGGLLATDTTPTLETVNGDTDSELRVLWATSNVDPVTFQVALPSDLDVTQDILVKIRAIMSGATNTPTVTLESFFNEGDTKVTDATGALSSALETETATIAAADIPAAAAGGTLTIEMFPGAHANDTVALYTIWLEIARTSAPRLEYTNGDTDSAHRVLWPAADVTPVSFQFSLPDDLDETQDMVLKFLGEMGGANDTPTIAVQSYFDTGDTAIADTSSALGDAIAEDSATIAGSDIPDGASTVTFELTPGTHGTDTLILYDLRLEYMVSSKPRLEYANGDTDSAHRVTWPAASVVPVTFQMSLPPDFDAASDIIIRFLGDMSGSNDTPTLAFQTYFDVGDTAVADTSSALGSSVAEDTVTIAAADFEAGVDTMTVEITPGSHGTDDLYLYDLRVEYKVGSSPSLGYVNGNTDSAWVVTWAAADVTPLSFQLPLPPDLDDAAAVEIHFRAKMSSTNDTPVISGDMFVNEGDTLVEADSAALSSSYAEKTITIGASDIPSGAQTLSVELTPGTHATDSILMSAVWLEYTRS